MKTLILFLIICSQSFAGDLYLRNNSGHDLRVKVRHSYETVKVNKVLKKPLDNSFHSKIEVIYQNRTVASTEIKPSDRDSRLRVYRKNNAWLIEEDRR